MFYGQAKVVISGAKFIEAVRGEIPRHPIHILTYRIQSIVKIGASRKRPKENKFIAK